MAKQSQNVQISIGRDELKILIQEAVHDALLDILGEDIHSEPNFKPEIAERLRRYRDQKPVGIPIDDVANELGLNV